MYKVSLSEAHFPAQGGEPPVPVTIGDMLSAAAAKWADQVALKELGFDGSIKRTWTYSEMKANAERLGRALASRHAKGSRVAVFAHNIPEWVLLELACGLAGVVLVTVNPSYQPRELKYVLEQSRSEAIYYVDAFRGNPIGDIVDKVCDDLPTIKHKIVLTNHNDLYAGEPEGELPNVAADDPVQIQYTSGTTGFPKGAVLHHNGLILNGVESMKRAGVNPGDVFINHMPMFHTTGCAMMVLGGFSVGATMLLAPIFDPVMITEVIEREKSAFMMGVPTMLVALIAEAKRSGRDMSSVRRLMSGGSMVPPELCRSAQETLGAPIQIVYGQTEASPVITQTWYEDTLEDLTQTIGQPVPFIDVSIRNPATNEVCSVGEQGEICARGYNVMHGYNDNPDATAAAIDSDGWLHTGDLGRMDARGYLKITGRVKEMIIRGGENLFPAEIENAVLEHDDVQETAVIGVPDEKFGELVACFMRNDSGKRPSNDELKAFLRERISPQKTPTFWFWVDEWPLTGSGKIQKFKLLEAYEAGEFG